MVMDLLLPFHASLLCPNPVMRMTKEPPLLNGVETISMCLLYRNPGIKDFYEAMGMMGLSGMEQPKGIVPDTVKCPPLYPPIWANETMEEITDCHDPPVVGQQVLHLKYRICLV